MRRLAPFIAMPFVLGGCIVGHLNVASVLVKSCIIGPAGGPCIVTAAEDAALAGTGVVIPAGALPAMTDITISASLQTVVQAGQTAAGPVVEFGPDGLQFQFAAAMTLTVAAPTDQSEGNIAIETVEANGKASLVHPWSINGNLAAFATDGFTRFGGVIQPSCNCPPVPSGACTLKGTDPCACQIPIECGSDDNDWNDGHIWQCSSDADCGGCPFVCASPDCGGSLCVASELACPYMALTVSPSNVTLPLTPNATTTLTATAAYSDGSTVNVSNYANWISSDPSMATATGGVVLPNTLTSARGTATVTATFDGTAASATVTLIAIDGGLPFNADAGSDHDGGSCAPETAAALCAQATLQCGAQSFVDNCGSTRTLDCGTCGAGSTCVGCPTNSLCRSTVGTCQPARSPLGTGSASCGAGSEPGVGQIAPVLCNGGINSMSGPECAVSANWTVVGCPYDGGFPPCVSQEDVQTFSPGSADASGGVPVSAESLSITLKLVTADTTDAGSDNNLYVDLVGPIGPAASFQNDEPPPSSGGRCDDGVFPNLIAQGAYDTASLAYQVDTQVVIPFTSMADGLGTPTLLPGEEYALIFYESPSSSRRIGIAADDDTTKWYPGGAGYSRQNSPTDAGCLSNTPWIEDALRDVNFCLNLTADSVTPGPLCGSNLTCDVVKQNCPDLPLDPAQPVAATNPPVATNCMTVGPGQTACIPAGALFAGQSGCTQECGSTANGQTGIIDNCSVGTQCVQTNGTSICMPTCNTTADCASGTTCWNGACQPSSDNDGGTSGECGADGGVVAACQPIKSESPSYVSAAFTAVSADPNNSTQANAIVKEVAQTFSFDCADCASGQPGSVNLVLTLLSETELITLDSDMLVDLLDLGPRAGVSTFTIPTEATSGQCDAPITPVTEATFNTGQLQYMVDTPVTVTFPSTPSVTLAPSHEYAILIRMESPGTNEIGIAGDQTAANWFPSGNAFIRQQTIMRQPNGTNCFSDSSFALTGDDVYFSFSFANGSQ